MAIRWMAGWFCFWLVLGLGLATFKASPWARRAPLPVIGLWHPDAGLLHMDVEDYVKGVVAAEMPALFHPEALKAQAVAARTYALRALYAGKGVPEHPRAVLTTGVAHQAWASKATMEDRWGDPANVPVFWGRIEAAVDATRGQILTYGGAPIEALYHADSGGHTEDAEAYFAAAQPYLKGVADPYGGHSPHALRFVRISLEEVASRLGLRALSAGDTPVAVTSRTPSGRAGIVKIGDAEFTGRRVRERLGLPSTMFDVHVEDGAAVWAVRGSGHGVGMAQYGADGMARRGASYDAILHHYYRGATLETVY